MPHKTMETNPWLAAPAPEEPQQALVPEQEESPGRDAVLGEEEVRLGPQVPLHSSAGSAPESQPPEGLVVLGLHGGAGATTLTRLLGEPARDARQPWSPGLALPAGWVVAVARIHGAGLQAATQFARAWSEGRVEVDGGRLLGVVLVDDAPKPSSAQTRRAKLLAGSTPRTWRVPWVEEWREAAPLSAGEASEEGLARPRRVRSTTKSIHGAHRAAVGN